MNAILIVWKGMNSAQLASSVDLYEVSIFFRTSVLDLPSINVVAVKNTGMMTGEKAN